MEKIRTEHFISFEGIDYSGKSTQIDLLKNYLEEKNLQVYFIREPGGTGISERIRDLLLDNKNHNMNSWTEIFLYSAARVQLVHEKIIPMLQSGKIVIADRFVDSTTAYQGYGRGIDLEIVRKVNEAATSNLLPGVTFYLELTPEEFMKRAHLAGRNADRLETAGIDFFRRVFNGYKEIAETNKDRFCIINATQSIDAIHSTIIQEIYARMGL